MLRAHGEDGLEKTGVLESQVRHDVGEVPGWIEQVQNGPDSFGVVAKKLAVDRREFDACVCVPGTAN